MAKLPPVATPGDDAGGDVELEMSPEERRKLAESEARMLAKQQRAELAKIRREMRSPMAKGALLWGGLSVALFALLVAGGYFLVCFSSVNTARKTCMDAYTDAQLDVIKRYAPADLTRVEKLLDKARNGSVIAETKTVCEDYKKAHRGLRDAQEKADDERKKYTRALSEFEELLEEAEQQELQKYTPEIYTQVQTLKEEAGAESGSSFSAAKAIAKLSEASRLLRDTRGAYESIRDYNTTFAAFREVHEKVVADEWSHNLPDELASLQSKMTRAEAAAQAGQWEIASAEYAAAADIVKPALTAVQEKRDKATAAVTRFNKALETSDTKRIAAIAKQAWAEIEGLKKAVTEALTAYRYGSALEAAEKGAALVESTAQKVATAEATRDEELKKLRDTWKEAEQHARFFRLNWRQEWTTVDEQYRRKIPGLIASEAFVTLLDKVKELTASLESLLERREKLLSETKQVKDALETLEKDPLVPIFKTNFPEFDMKLTATRNNAARSERRDQLAAAKRLYAAARNMLEDGLQKFQALRKTCTELNDACRTRRKQFDTGIRLFRFKAIREIDELMAQTGSATRQKNFSRAYPLLKRLDKLLPEARFTFERDGTAVDNEVGVMWAKDGNGPGCYSGKRCTWSEADEWVRKLDFAGYADWRLPTYDELQVVLRMTAANRGRVFDNTKNAIYWSGTYDTILDVDRMLAVDFERGRNVKMKKGTPCFVRAIRSPR